MGNLELRKLGIGNCGNLELWKLEKLRTVEIGNCGNCGNEEMWKFGIVEMRNCGNWELQKMLIVEIVKCGKWEIGNC